MREERCPDPFAAPARCLLRTMGFYFGFFQVSEIVGEKYLTYQIFLYK